MVMSSLLTDGGLRDCVPRTARDHVAKFYGAPAGDPGADSGVSVVKLSLVLVRVSLV